MESFLQIMLCVCVAAMTILLIALVSCVVYDLAISYRKIKNSDGGCDPSEGLMLKRKAFGYVPPKSDKPF